jgi:hypothetical protein
MLGRASAALTLAVWLGAGLAGGERAAAAEVVISINKATQTMSVLIDGAEAYNWTVSTGVGGGPYDGTYRPGRMERKWASRKYNMAPMPYSIFFDGNYAIHGTVKISQLGRRASKGCVRLHPRDAAVLFALVGKEKATTTIVVDKATHVAARPAPVKSDAVAVEAKAAPAQNPAVAAPALITADRATVSERADAAIAPVRKRSKRARDTASAKPLPFGANYATAQ